MSFSTEVMFEQDPAVVFDGITNVRGWWSRMINGDTDRLNAEFEYRYQDVHRCKFRITEFDPPRRVVWRVLENHFNFTKDPAEWVGNDIIFEIEPAKSGTQLRFTQEGLVPQYECYEICAEAWGTYITRSLRDLVVTGIGQPNPIDEVVRKAEAMSGSDFSISFEVKNTAKEVFAAVTRAHDWWSPEIDGKTDKVGATFDFRHESFHFSRQLVSEVVPDRRIVWDVVESNLSFVRNRSEWTGTSITFDIVPSNGKTKLVFTHIGLVPSLECYMDCAGAWTDLVQQDLHRLITS